IFIPRCRSTMQHWLQGSSVPIATVWIGARPGTTPNVRRRWAMETGPEYQRAETRVDVDEPDGAPVADRRVATARTTRSSPAAIVVVATPGSLADALAAESSYGWFLVIVGAAVALVALFVPDRSSRVVTYRN